jgi:hypothetical protein
MNSKKELFETIQPYFPFGICNQIYSYICSDKCTSNFAYGSDFVCTEEKCMLCRSGQSKYSYFSGYIRSIKTIQRWLKKYYYSGYRCCELMHTYQVYHNIYHCYCRKQIPKKLYQKYKSLKCHLHFKKYIDIFGIYRKPFNEDFHYRIMMASRNT